MDEATDIGGLRALFTHTAVQARLYRRLADFEHLLVRQREVVAVSAADERDTVVRILEYTDEDEVTHKKGMEGKVASLLVSLLPFEKLANESAGRFLLERTVGVKEQAFY